MNLKTWLIALVAALLACLGAAPQADAQAATYYVDNGGSDANPGTLASPFQHLNYCVSYAYQNAYGGANCKGTSGQTFQELVSIYDQFPGGGTIQIGSTAAGQIVMKAPASTYAAALGDGALVGFNNVHFEAAAGALGLVHGHQFGVADFNTGITFDTGAPSAIDCDFDTQININAGVTLNGPGGTSILYQACPGSTWSINGAQALSNSPVVGRWAWAQPSARMVVQGNVSFAAGLSTSGGALVNSNATLLNFSGFALPGGAPQTTGIGVYCTNLLSC